MEISLMGTPIFNHPQTGAFSITKFSRRYAGMLHGFIGGLVCDLNLPSIELKPPTEYTDQAIIGVVFFFAGVSESFTPRTGWT
jgi:hypothetical protein